MNSPSMVLTWTDVIYLGPLAVLTIGGLVLILLEALVLGKHRQLMMGACVFFSVVAALVGGYLYHRIGEAPPEGGARYLFGGGRNATNGMLRADKASMFFSMLFAIVTALTALASAAHQKEHDWENGEFYGVLLLAAAGMAMLAMAADLVTVFLGVETMSIATYVLTASRRRSRRSAEAAMKYFLMGAFATGFLLYGIALVYGATGATDLINIRVAAAKAENAAVLVVGIFMLVVGFGFKIAAVPFHMWAPDVYEGAPTPVTGFMAAAVKAAAVAGMVRVFGDGLGGEIIPYGRMGWSGILAGLSALTMTIGNVAALRQQNVKRMLAFSSVSHAGVLLAGVTAVGLNAGEPAREAIIYYLTAYSVTTIGAFAVVAWVGSKHHERVLVDDWAGLASKHPLAALAMTLFMLSLGGVPPTAGFVGKFLIFESAMKAYDQQLVWLVVVGVINSVISIYYYLRLVMTMYFREPVGEFQPTRAAAYVFVLVVTAALVLHMGILPGRWLAYATS